MARTKAWRAMTGQLKRAISRHLKREEERYEAKHT